MGHIDNLKKLFFEQGYTEEDFTEIKKIILEYYKFYLEKIKNKINLFTCNKKDFFSILKIALDNDKETHKDMAWNIYNRYVAKNDVLKEEFDNFDSYVHWQSMFEKGETPDEELFEKILELL